ncbi:MAG: tRNA pseudouridine(38-40) synthase TruA [Candidatus Kapaibacterium sp.]
MSRLRLLIEYDGTDYVGWQRQSNGVSVQQRVEEALSVAYGVPCIIHGAGRTDAGVHASGQCAHVELPDGAHEIPIEKAPVAINTRLPKDIRILGVEQVHDSFHARFDAIWREYVYSIALVPRVFNRRTSWHTDLPYDRDLFAEALASMRGQHNFTAFSKSNPSTTSYICDLQICQTSVNGDVLEVRLRADRFVYGMCRAIIGASMSVARKRLSIDELTTLHDSAQRLVAPSLAPAHGLCLVGVGYPDQPLSQD